MPIGGAAGRLVAQSNFNRSRRLTDAQKQEYLGRIGGTGDIADLAVRLAGAASSPKPLVPPPPPPPPPPLCNPPPPP
eukprot:COSAG01_NODE_23328_length_819_cov_1.476389_1_plen_76_part_10